MRFLDTSRIRTRFDRRIRARDGTELSLDLYLPAQPGRYPVLLTRTAADNNRSGRVLPGATTLLPAPADRWKALAAQGFIVAAADVRGRGDSDGSFIPFLHEATDGVDTVEWVRAHEECSGRVGVFGSGYSAFCAWAALAAGAPVDAIASISPLGAIGESLVHRGGALQLGSLFWLHLIGGRTLQPAGVPPWPKIHRHLPLRSLDAALGRSDTAWQEWMKHFDAADRYWAPLDILDDIASRPVAGLHVTGWWDIHLGAARTYYAAASRSGAPQRLIIGPWDTTACRRPVAQVGGFDFGPRSVLDVDETLATFFRSHFVDAAAGPTRAASIFVTGSNEWHDAEGWPEIAARVPWTMASVQGANTRGGDGTLQRASDHTSLPADVVVHNPAIPVEFQPMFVSFAAGSNPLGFTLDQAHVTARDEALCYTGSDSETATHIRGRARLSVTVQTDAADADLIVLLSDVFPLGSRDLHLAHGALRLSTLPAFAPGRPQRVEIVLNDVAHELLPGHRLRLTLVPSLFPLYAANPQAGDYLDATATTVAEIRVLHDPPGVLELPMVKA